MPYVSITGLRLKAIWHAPRFWWHASRAMAQARAAPGNLSAEARFIDGYNLTLSSWIDQAAMRRYLTSGAHLAAMRAFHSFATGRSIGFSAAATPDWAEAHAIWLEQAQEVRK
jgi:quinol monooxygenase YgiN